VRALGDGPQRALFGTLARAKRLDDARGWIARRRTPRPPRRLAIPSGSRWPHQASRAVDGPPAEGAHQDGTEAVIELRHPPAFRFLRGRCPVEDDALDLTAFTFERARSLAVHTR